MSKIINYLSQWRYDRIFWLAFVIKAFVLLIAVASFAIIPMPKMVEHTFNKDFLTGFYQYDAANFRAICITGYTLPYVAYPESLKLFSFLPGVAITDCIARVAKSVVNLDNWGGVIVSILFFPLFCISIKYYLDTLNISLDKKWYLFWFINLFPTAFFLHLNYTEVYFLTGLLFAMGAAKKGRWDIVLYAGIFISLFRTTSIPLGIIFALWFIYDTIKYNTSLNTTQLITKIVKFLPLFSLFGLGSLLTFAYYYIQYNNFFLYLDSEKIYFERDSYTVGFNEITNLFKGSYKSWADYYDTIRWSSLTQDTGFYFYTKQFRNFFYAWSPFIYFSVGLLILLLYKKFIDILISISVVVTGAASGINSLNRYVFHAIPVAVIIGSFYYKLKFVRFIILFISLCLFCLFMILHMRTYWVA